MAPPLSWRFRAEGGDEVRRQLSGIRQELQSNDEATKEYLRTRRQERAVVREVLNEGKYQRDMYLAQHASLRKLTEGLGLFSRATQIAMQAQQAWNMTQLLAATHTKEQTDATIALRDAKRQLAIAEQNGASEQEKAGLQEQVNAAKARGEEADKQAQSDKINGVLNLGTTIAFLASSLGHLATKTPAVINLLKRLGGGSTRDVLSGGPTQVPSGGPFRPPGGGFASPGGIANANPVSMRCTTLCGDTVTKVADSISGKLQSWLPIAMGLAMGTAVGSLLPLPKPEVKVTNLFNPQISIENKIPELKVPDVNVQVLSPDKVNVTIDRITTTLPIAINEISGTASIKVDQLPDDIKVHLDNETLKVQVDNLQDLQDSIKNGILAALKEDRDAQVKQQQEEMAKNIPQIGPSNNKQTQDWLTAGIGGWLAGPIITSIFNTIKNGRLGDLEALRGFSFKLPNIEAFGLDHFGQIPEAEAYSGESAKNTESPFNLSPITEAIIAKATAFQASVTNLSTTAEDSAKTFAANMGTFNANLLATSDGVNKNVSIAGLLFSNNIFAAADQIAKSTAEALTTFNGTITKEMAAGLDAFATTTQGIASSILSKFKSDAGRIVSEGLARLREAAKSNGPAVQVRAAAVGIDTVISKPTLLKVGEAGAERVIVKPASQATEFDAVPMDRKATPDVNFKPSIQVPSPAVKGAPIISLAGMPSSIEKHLATNTIERILKQQTHQERDRISTIDRSETNLAQAAIPKLNLIQQAPKSIMQLLKPTVRIVSLPARSTERTSASPTQIEPASELSMQSKVLAPAMPNNLVSNSESRRQFINNTRQSMVSNIARSREYKEVQQVLSESSTNEKSLVQNSLLSSIKDRAKEVINNSLYRFTSRAESSSAETLQSRVAATGLDTVVNKPTLIKVGEAGAERVRVEPASQRQPKISMPTLASSTTMVSPIVQAQKAMMQLIQPVIRSVTTRIENSLAVNNASPAKVQPMITIAAGKNSSEHIQPILHAKGDNRQDFIESTGSERVRLHSSERHRGNVTYNDIVNIKSNGILAGKEVINIVNKNRLTQQRKRNMH